MDSEPEPFLSLNKHEGMNRVRLTPPWSRAFLVIFNKILKSGSCLLDLAEMWPLQNFYSETQTCCRAPGTLNPFCPRDPYMTQFCRCLLCFDTMTPSLSLKGSAGELESNILSASERLQYSVPVPSFLGPAPEQVQPSLSRDHM
ncbi:hypothetical protein CHARACLAT_016017 [Characodon lateralis]|uniref:Uncharacterized protein n=1 Tax=Characodon lateralis TaxID=208331 RepID=A0ABU7F3Y5_9TELE|nr:hypothetical protein [Characodon lateralis]